MTHKIHVIICLLTGLLGGLGLMVCAKQAPPSGGPVDKTPPEIIKVSPQPNSTSVPLDQQVELTFSERVDKKSVEESLFISPNPGENLKLHWKGKRLRLEFLQGLKKDRTYVLTIGTDTRDLRNNRMESSFALAFSTGDSLDQGQIAGQVHGTDKVEGALVWAYILQNDRIPDPAKHPPEYVTQCDAKGHYRLSYLSPGTYRLFAVLDKDGDREYQVEYDALGVTTSDVEIRSDSLTVEGLDFRIAVRDTTPPSLLSCVTTDQYHLNLRFDESLMAPSDLTMSNNFLIITNDSLTNDTLRIREAYQSTLDLSKIHLITEKQIAGAEYQLTVHDLFDTWGNPVDTASNTCSFSGSSRPDTLSPRLISKSPEDSARNVSLIEPVRLTFSEALNQSSLEKHFSMFDSSGTTISGRFIWKTPACVEFSPAAKLASLMTYRVYVAVDSVFDGFDNALADSSLEFVFTTLNADALSSISGTVEDESQSGNGRIFLTAAQVPSGRPAYSISIEAPGPYTFEDILPGIYLIHGFRDADNNGSYSYGQAVPFVPAERFVFYPDSIKVRSRWPNEGNDIVFKK